MKLKRFYIAAPYVIWAAGFIILPLFVIIYYAFTDAAGAFTFDNITAVAQPVYRKALLLSVELGLATTGICLLLAYPLALILKHLKLSRMSFILFVVVLPMWMNFVLRVMAWQIILSKNGVLNHILGMLGLGALNIINTPAAIGVGMVYDFLPYMILPIYNTLTAIPEDLTEASNDLGAGPLQTFFRVILPLSRPGIMSGITMVFIPSMTAFVVSDVLGGSKIQLLGNVIEHEFLTALNWNLGSGLSVALMVFALAGALFMRGAEDGKEGSVLW